MNPVPILPDRLDWPSAIGNFLLNFGTLEYLVFVLLKDHLQPEEFDRVKEYHLKDRLNRIQQQLKQKGYLPVSAAHQQAQQANNIRLEARAIADRPTSPSLTATGRRKRIKTNDAKPSNGKNGKPQGAARGRERLRIIF